MLSVHYDTRAIAHYIMVPLVPLVPLVHGGQPHHRHSKFCCSVLHCHILKLLTAASCLHKFHEESLFSCQAYEQRGGLIIRATISM